MIIDLDCMGITAMELYGDSPFIIFRVPECTIMSIDNQGLSRFLYRGKCYALPRQIPYTAMNKDIPGGSPLGSEKPSSVVKDFLARISSLSRRG
jgi:hypothetical protein